MLTKDDWIKRMARYYKEPEEKVRKQVEKDPEILDGYIEYEMNERYDNGE